LPGVLSPPLLLQRTARPAAGAQGSRYAAHVSFVFQSRFRPGKSTATAWTGVARAGARQPAAGPAAVCTGVLPDPHQCL